MFSACSTLSINMSCLRDCQSAQQHAMQENSKRTHLLSFMNRRERGNIRWNTANILKSHLKDPGNLLNMCGIWIQYNNLKKRTSWIVHWGVKFQPQEVPLKGSDQAQELLVRSVRKIGTLMNFPVMFPPFFPFISSLTCMVLPGDRHHYLRSLGGAWMLQGLVRHQQTIASKVPRSQATSANAKWQAIWRHTKPPGWTVKWWKNGDAIKSTRKY